MKNFTESCYHQRKKMVKRPLIVGKSHSHPHYTATLLQSTLFKGRNNRLRDIGTHNNRNKKTTRKKPGKKLLLASGF